MTAGIFLLIRSHFLLLPHPNIIFYITATGSFTAFTAANYASTILDPKKVIALSTISQLGIIMATVGLGLPQLAYFHLITHAMFKALMFMCAGIIISKKSHSQNLRRVGSADESLLLAILFKIARLSLNAVPFIAGFYSKDLILEELAIKIKICPTFIIILFASMLTATYTARLVRGRITTKPHHHSLPPLSNSHELDQTIITPSLILGVRSISMGAMTA